MRNLFKHKSLVKNWPGGRRNATVLSSIPFEGSAMLWNTKVVEFTRPYVVEEKQLSNGGMANPHTIMEYARD